VYILAQVADTELVEGLALELQGLAL